MDLRSAKLDIWSIPQLNNSRRVSRSYSTDIYICT